ncbi:MAG TPA: hypothetical protein VMZ11_04970 [Mycobacteriales bacterium]|nr:hypothetical protein [Mycobacteriales bacterium]
MSTTDTLKHGTEAVVEKTADAAAEIAERARKQAEALVLAAEQVAGQAAAKLGKSGRAKPRRTRGRKLIGFAVITGVGAWVAKKARTTLQQRRQQQEVIDLTLGNRSNGAAPQSADTGATTGTAP